MHSSSVLVPVVPRLVPSSVLEPRRIGTAAMRPAVMLIWGYSRMKAPSMAPNHSRPSLAEA
jgi:hypothetical protein